MSGSAGAGSSGDASAAVRRTLLLDCDGVLADTERDGHLVAFNAMFTVLGLPMRWSEGQYARLVRIGGGKERLASALTPQVVAELGLPEDAEGLAAVVAEWHRIKTAIYADLIRTGAVPPRPGVRRLVGEALDAGWSVAVASTSARRSVVEVLDQAVGRRLAARVRVFAGDVVPRKKPAPDIYLLALTELGSTPAESVVVEDSGVGLAAARAAGLPVVVTTSSYTADDDLDAAAVVLSDLGEPGHPATVVADPWGIGVEGLVDLDALERVIRRGAEREPEPPGA